MTPKERSAAIYKVVEAFHQELDRLSAETSIVAVAIDENLETGFGVSRVRGNSRILLEMAGTVVKTLPQPEFMALLTAMATGQQFAANRGEDPEPVAPIDPKLVN